MPLMHSIGCYHNLHHSNINCMRPNMGTADRLTRTVIALLLAGLYFTGVVTNPTLATFFWVIGIVFLITASIGFCPLYTLGGFNTLGSKRK